MIYQNCQKNNNMIVYNLTQYTEDKEEYFKDDGE